MCSWQYGRMWKIHTLTRPLIKREWHNKISNTTYDCLSRSSVPCMAIWTHDLPSSGRCSRRGRRADACRHQAWWRLPVSLQVSVSRCVKVKCRKCERAIENGKGSVLYCFPYFVHTHSLNLAARYSNRGVYALRHFRYPTKKKTQATSGITLVRVTDM